MVEGELLEGVPYIYPTKAAPLTGFPRYLINTTTVILGGNIETNRSGGPRIRGEITPD